MVRKGIGVVELDGRVRSGRLGVAIGKVTLGDDAPDKSATLGAREVWVGPVWTREDSDGGVVDVAVRLMALNVLVTIFDGSDAEDDKEGQYDETGGDGGELREELEDGYEEEEAGGG